jgi:hypothetical protein
MKTAEIRALFLQQLAAECGGHFVEELRCSASILDGTAPQCGEPANTQVRFQMAAKLREAAAKLCDHARFNSDGTCRYCDTFVVEVSDR